MADEALYLPDPAGFGLGGEAARAKRLREEPDVDIDSGASSSLHQGPDEDIRSAGSSELGPENDVLARWREKYPRYKEVPDDELAVAIAHKYPRYAPLLRPYLSVNQDVPVDTRKMIEGAPPAEEGQQQPGLGERIGNLSLVKRARGLAESELGPTRRALQQTAEDFAGASKMSPLTKPLAVPAGALDFVAGQVTPEGAALGIGMTGATLPRAVSAVASGGFAYLAGKQAVEKAPQVFTAVQQGRYSDALRLSTAAGLDAVTAFLAGVHGTTELADFFRGGKAAGAVPTKPVQEPAVAGQEPELRFEGFPEEPPSEKDVKVAAAVRENDLAATEALRQAARQGPGQRAFEAAQPPAAPKRVPNPLSELTLEMHPLDRLTLEGMLPERNEERIYPPPEPEHLALLKQVEAQKGYVEDSDLQPDVRARIRGEGDLANLVDQITSDSRELLGKRRYREQKKEENFEDITESERYSGMKSPVPERFQSHRLGKNVWSNYDELADIIGRGLRGEHLSPGKLEFFNKLRTYYENREGGRPVTDDDIETFATNHGIDITTKRIAEANRRPESEAAEPEGGGEAEFDPIALERESQAQRAMAQHQTADALEELLGPDNEVTKATRDNAVASEALAHQVSRHEESEPGVVKNPPPTPALADEAAFELSVRGIDAQNPQEIADLAAAMRGSEKPIRVTTGETRVSKSTEHPEHYQYDLAQGTPAEVIHEDSHRMDAERPLPLAQAVTGRPFSDDLFHGDQSQRGKTGGIYSSLFPAEPILGRGFYGTPERAYAEHFGPVTKERITIENPLVIDSDEQWRALTSEAGWKFPNPAGLDKAEISQQLRALRSLIERKGHDGVIIRIPKVDVRGLGLVTDEAVAKTIGRLFDHDTAVSFEGSGSTRFGKVPKAPEPLRRMAGKGVGQEPFDWNPREEAPGQAAWEAEHGAPPEPPPPAGGAPPAGEPPPPGGAGGGNTPEGPGANDKLMAEFLDELRGGPQGHFWQRSQDVKSAVESAADGIELTAYQNKIFGEQHGRIGAQGTIGEEGTEAGGKAAEATREKFRDMEVKPDTYRVMLSQEQIAHVNAMVDKGLTLAKKFADDVKVYGDPASKKTAEAMNALVDHLLRESVVTRFAAGRMVKQFDRPGQVRVRPEDLYAVKPETLEALKQVGRLADELRDAKIRKPIYTNIYESFKKWGSLDPGQKAQLWRDIVDAFRLNLFSVTSWSLDLITNMAELSGQGAAALGRDLYGLSRGQAFYSLRGFMDALRTAPKWKEQWNQRMMQNLVGPTVGGENVLPKLPGMEGGPEGGPSTVQLLTGRGKGPGTFTERSNPASRFLDWFVGVPLYSKGLFDQGAAHLASQATLFAEAYKATPEGLSPMERANFREQFVQNPTDAAVDAAMEAGNKAKFNRPLSELEEKIGRSTTVRLAFEAFARWPFQFTRWFGEMVGVDPAAYRKMFPKGGGVNGEAVAGYLAKAATGLGGLYLLNHTLYDNVDFHSMEWVDPKDGNRVRLTGREPLPTALTALSLFRAVALQSSDDWEKFRAGLQFSSIPFGKVFSFTGGLLSNVVNIAKTADQNKKLDPLAMRRDLENWANSAIPGQALLSMLKTFIDPVIREGIGAKLPAVSLALPAVPSPTTGQQLAPEQSLLGSPKFRQLGGVPIPGAKRELDPVYKLLMQFGSPVYRGPRQPIVGQPEGVLQELEAKMAEQAGLRKLPDPDTVKREFESELGSNRLLLLHPLATRIHPGDKPGLFEVGGEQVPYEELRKRVTKTDALAARLASNAIMRKYGLMPIRSRAESIRELVGPASNLRNLRAAQEERQQAIAKALQGQE